MTENSFPTIFCRKFAKKFPSNNKNSSNDTTTSFNLQITYSVMILPPPN